MAPRSLSVSVGALVGFALRAGDLVRGGPGSAQRLAAGSRAHRQLQRRRPPGYQAEVPVSHLLQRDGLVLEICGRVDGVALTADALLVEEIKTTGQLPDADYPGAPAHWAQAKVYAFIVATQAQRAAVDVRLTYVCLEPFATRELHERCTQAALASFVDGLLEAYLRWARAYDEWCRVRDASIACLPFPFPRLRPGQGQLIEAVQAALDGDARLFVEAPTGIGKTICVLYPAVRALGSGQVDKVFYLTPKTVVRTAAEKAVADLRAAGLRLRSLTLTARERICCQGQGRTACDPRRCPYALGYFDRLDAALADGFRQETLTRPAIEELARRHQVCPFELQLDLSLWVDLLVCDYNYAFDPAAYLRRFFLDDGGRYALLVDEAHDLVDRAREMFSAELRAGALAACAGRFGARAEPLAAHLHRLADEVRAAGPAAGDGAVVLESVPSSLRPLLADLLPLAERVLAAETAGDDWQALAEQYYAAQAFLRLTDELSEEYTCYAERHGRQARLRLFCLDPARQLRAALRRGCAAVFFSATLTPLDYFRDLLGGRAGDALLSLEPPFPADNLHVLVGRYVATTLRRRAASYAAVAEAIATVVGARPGNYLAFFPSYRYLEAVARHLAARDDLELAVQRPGLSEAEREAFLARFATDNGGPLVGMVVMGGLFGEGIDLSGERLIGAVIVGVGLPQLCLERDLISAHFAARGAPGFEYAYTYPGMNRVLQAAGRVIRSETDRGVVLLLDERFCELSYQQLLPRWWQPLSRVGSAAAIGAALAAFWGGIREPRYVPLDE